MPKRWWFITAAGVVVAGAEIFGGFGWHVAVVVYAALVVPATALLVGMSRARIRVDSGGLHAGGRTLPLADIASARALDVRDARHHMGPGADPAAHVVTRGFIPAAVLVRPSGSDSTPYWLLSTRHPDQLLAALGRNGAVTP